MSLKRKSGTEVTNIQEIQMTDNEQNISCK